MSEIVFEPLPQNSGQRGSARVRLPAVRVHGGNVPDAESELAPIRIAATGRVTRRGSAIVRLDLLRIAAGPRQRGAVSLPPLQAYARDVAIVVGLNVARATVVGPQVVSSGRVVRHGSATVRLPRLPVFGTDMSAVGRVTLPTTQVSAYSLPPIERYLSAFQTPGFVYATLGAALTPRAVVQERIALGNETIANQVALLTDRLSIDDAPASILAALARIQENVEFVDKLGTIWAVLVAESLGLAGEPAASIVTAARLAETLALVAGAGSSLSVRNLVAETLALHDTLAVIAKERLADTAHFGDVFASHLTMRARALDAFLIADAAAAGLQVRALITDALAIEATQSSAAEMLAKVQEQIGFAVTVRVGDDVFLAWVVNTETHAATQYENFPFNSFAGLGGRYFAAAPDGIYLLGGADDDGDAIRARFRIGLSNLGTGKEKRMPAMYWGYRADGSMVLKVIVTEPTGEKVENWYALRPRGAGATREGRVQIGRGLKAVYWDFEVANINGADFDVDSLELFPMILDRRVRGRDG